MSNCEELNILLPCFLYLSSSATFVHTVFEFEEAIPHIDIINCPNDIGISEDSGFCRRMADLYMALNLLRMACPPKSELRYQNIY